MSLSYASTSYNILHTFTIKIYFGAKAPTLKRLYARFESPNLSGAADFDLFLCKKRADIPHDVTRIVASRYKGVPWVAATAPARGRPDGSIYFYTPFFCTFLAVRTVLNPLIKRELLNAGGFSFIGSACVHENELVLVSGHPGRGKTRLLLSAVERGARFVSDNEIVVSKSTQAQNLCDEIELRHDTIRRTRFWSALSMRQKFLLFFYKLCSVLTFRRVTFGISIPPKQIGIETTRNVGTGRVRYIYLDDVNQPQKMTIGDVRSGFSEYENWYAQLYRELFLTAELRELAAHRMSEFLQSAALWKCPSHWSLDQILQATKSK
jgi:hypothetical protein